MSHINPVLPVAGDKNWATPLNAALMSIVDQVNLLDDGLASVSSSGGSGGNYDPAGTADGAVAAQAAVDAQAYQTIATLAESVQDLVGGMVINGTNISTSYDDTTGKLTISATGGVDAEAVRDTIGATLVNGNNINIAVDDTNNTITISTPATVNRTDAATDSAIAAAVGPISTALNAKAPLASPQFSGLFGVGDTATTGIPFTVVNTITAASAIAAGSANIVGTQFNSIFSGNYTAMAGDDPGYLFGGDHMTHVFGVSGVNQIHGFIGEVAIDAPAGTTIPVVIGLESGMCFWGSTAGATVTQAISMHVASPTKRLHGATAGTATDAYGLKIDAVAGATGANFSLFVEESSISRIGGTLQSNRVESYGSSFYIGGVGTYGTGMTFSGPTASSGYAVVSLPGTADGTRFTVQNGSSQTGFFVTASGKVGFPNAFVRTGVGATGTATALPANPLGYLAVELNGSTVNIPYYNFG